MPSVRHVADAKIRGLRRKPLWLFTLKIRGGNWTRYCPLYIDSGGNSGQKPGFAREEEQAMLVY